MLHSAQHEEVELGIGQILKSIDLHSERVSVDPTYDSVLERSDYLIEVNHEYNLNLT